MQADKRTYLVTGGPDSSGRMVDALVQAGHTVRVVDNFSTGKRRTTRGGLIDLREISIADRAALNEAMRVSIMFHLAALASVPRSVDDLGCKSTTSPAR